MIFEQVKVQWAKLGDNAGNKYMSEDKEWSVDVLLTDEQATKWAESGVKPAFKEKDGQKVVTLRKDCVYAKSGDPQKAPLVFDEFGEPLDVLVGNNSVANVQFTVRDWEYMGKQGKTAKLVALQVLELVEYAGGGDGVEFTFNDKVATSVLTESDDVVPF